jgi:beta-phosphoglucomutase-like phosphatase (HAD superfamily)
MASFPEITRENFDAALFDLDGVLTSTAKFHAAAWKQTFDIFLKAYAEARKESFVPFDISKDYRLYVDGKTRFDGVRSFLISRGIDLPYGAPTDPPTAETVCGVGNQKNELVNQIMVQEGVEAYPGSVKAVNLRKERAASHGGYRRAQRSNLVPPARGNRAHDRSHGRGTKT